MHACACSSPTHWQKWKEEDAEEKPEEEEEEKENAEAQPSGDSTMPQADGSIREFPLIPLPDRSLAEGKQNHYFISYQKEHSQYGDCSKLLALDLHDSLQSYGLTGDLDIDHAKYCQDSEVCSAVQRSCAMLVVISDELFGTPRFMLEWKSAQDRKIPTAFVLDCDRFKQEQILERYNQTVPSVDDWTCMSAQVRTDLRQYTWIEYTEALRTATFEEGKEWITSSAGREEQSSPQAPKSGLVQALGAMNKEVATPALLSAPSVAQVEQRSTSTVGETVCEAEQGDGLGLVAKPLIGQGITLLEQPSCSTSPDQPPLLELESMPLRETEQRDSVIVFEEKKYERTSVILPSAASIELQGAAARSPKKAAKVKSKRMAPALEPFAEPSPETLQ